MIFYAETDNFAVSCIWFYSKT